MSSSPLAMTGTATNSTVASTVASTTLATPPQQQDSGRSSTASQHLQQERRRSAARMHIPLGDAAGTGDLHHPGSGTGTAGSPRISGRPSTMAWPSGDKSPHHQRAPSLGELHQELENEQEAQVNRLLHMIRQQQDQIQAIQAAQATPSSSYTAVDVSTPTSERSLCLHSHPISIPLPPQQQQQPQQQSHPQQQRTRSPFAITRQASYRSHGSSRAASPALGTPASSATGTEAEWPSPAGPVRDESAFYSAETASLARENLMLKLRIRDLERQIADLDPTVPTPKS